MQNLITNSAKLIITKWNASITDEIQKEVEQSATNSIKNEYLESNLRLLTWTETSSDISRTENKHIGNKYCYYYSNVAFLCITHYFICIYLFQDYL